MGDQDTWVSTSVNFTRRRVKVVGLRIDRGTSNEAAFGGSGVFEIARGGEDGLNLENDDNSMNSVRRILLSTHVYIDGGF